MLVECIKEKLIQDKVHTSPDSLRHHSARLSARENKPDKDNRFRNSESASPQVKFPNFGHRNDSSRKHTRKKMMSNLPIGMKKSTINTMPADGLSERGPRLLVVPEEASNFRNNRIKQISSKSNNRSACNNVMPSENMSVGSLSGLSKSRLLATNKALKTVNTQSSIVQASELTASQVLRRGNTKKSNSGTLEINSNLLNKIMNKKSDQALEASNRAQDQPVLRSLESDARGKYLNIALSSAKNINMFEINNYFSSYNDKHLSARETTHSKSKPGLSKQFMNNISDMSKHKPTSKGGQGKQPIKKASTKQASAYRDTLQAKLNAIATTWKNKQQSNE